MPMTSTLSGPELRKEMERVWNFSPCQHPVYFCGWTEQRGFLFAHPCKRHPKPSITTVRRKAMRRETLPHLPRLWPNR